MNLLVNLVIPDVDELADSARSGARSIQHRPNLLMPFVQHSPLPLQFKQSRH